MFFFNYAGNTHGEGASVFYGRNKFHYFIEYCGTRLHLVCKYRCIDELGNEAGESSYLFSMFEKNNHTMAYS